MQFKIKPKAASILKMPSELEMNRANAFIEEVHAHEKGGIACYCPECGLEHSFIDDWPIDILIVCDGSNCQCRFLIPNTVAIIE